MMSLRIFPARLVCPSCQVYWGWLTDNPNKISNITAILLTKFHGLALEINRKSAAPMPLRVTVPFWAQGGALARHADRRSKNSRRLPGGYVGRACVKCAGL